jgi:hypothetical protein
LDLELSPDPDPILFSEPDSTLLKQIVSDPSKFKSTECGRSAEVQF